MIEAIGAISGMGGFGSVGSISSVTGLGSSFGTTSSGSTTSGTGAVSASANTFGLNLNDALSKVQGQIDNADALSQQLATGQLTDIHEFTVAASKASLSVQLTVAMRNQALGAFQEIMRMQL